MKNFFYPLCIAICLFACHSSETMNSNIFQVDVKESHSSIQLKLADVAEVEYIKLANDSDFLVRTKPLVCSNNYIPSLYFSVYQDGCRSAQGARAVS